MLNCGKFKEIFPSETCGNISHTVIFPLLKLLWKSKTSSENLRLFISQKVILLKTKKFAINFHFLEKTFERNFQTIEKLSLHNIRSLRKETCSKKCREICFDWVSVIFFLKIYWCKDCLKKNQYPDLCWKLQGFSMEYLKHFCENFFCSSKNEKIKKFLWKFFFESDLSFANNKCMNSI